MVQVEGKFLRQYQGLPYAARVTVYVQSDQTGPHVLVECGGQPGSSQGDVEEATAMEYTDWKQGAEAGVRHALKETGQEQFCVRIIRIAGMSTDTNPTIVGAAAMQAVWQALGYNPLATEIERIERIVFGSWQEADDFVPNFDFGEEP